MKSGLLGARLAVLATTLPSAGIVTDCPLTVLKNFPR